MAAELLTDLSRATDANSNPLSGATWSFYATGTLTPLAVYADADLSTSLGATVTADAGGQFADIYFNASLRYRGILKNAAGTTIKDVDPINTGVLSAVQEQFASMQEEIDVRVAVSGNFRRIRMTAGEVSTASVVTDGVYNLLQDDGTVLAALPDGKECAQLQPFWDRVLGRSQDVHRYFLGDSTGNASNEFVYLNCRQVFREIVRLTGTFYTVKYRLCTETSGTPTGWNAAETWQTGTSAYTIWFHNGSVPGANHNSFLGVGYDNLFSDGSSGTATDILFNLGHNEGYTTTFDSVCDAFLNLLTNFSIWHPQTPMVLILQNPYLGGSATTPTDIGYWTPLVQRAQRFIGSKFGVGFADTWSGLNSEYIRLGRTDFLSTYYDADGSGVHNNAAGSKIRAAALGLATAYNPNLSYRHADVMTTRQSQFVNTFFNTWASTNPDDWTPVNTAFSKDASWKATYAYSAKLTNSANVAYIWQRLDTKAHLLSNGDQYVAAYAKALSTVGSGFGRWQWVTDSATTSSNGSILGDGKARWYCARIPKQSTQTLQVRFLTGDSGNVVNVDRVAFGPGVMPFEPEPEGFPTITDYYVAENVVLTRNAAGTVLFPGTLTVVGTNIDYTAPTDSQSRFAINMTWLEVGESYEVAFNSDSGGADHTIRANAGTYGNGTTSGAAQALVAGANSFTFAATALVMSLLIIRSPAGTIGFDSITITKVP